MNDMPCVILAGGKGTRLSEETTTIPKPMLDIGGKPLLQHIMDIYMLQGIHEFIIPVGHKKEQVFGYFYSLHPLTTIGFQDGQEFRYGHRFQVTVVDTGEDTMTGGRLLRLADVLQERPFHFTYGDGVGNVNIDKVMKSVLGSTDLGAITVVHPEGRFGRAILNDQHRVISFGEKDTGEDDWINGGFSVLSPPVLGGIRIHGSDQCNLEKDIYPAMAASDVLIAVPHTGYWKCVDTLRDLEDLRHTYDKEGAKWLKLL